MRHLELNPISNVWAVVLPSKTFMLESECLELFDVKSLAALGGKKKSLYDIHPSVGGCDVGVAWYWETLIL